MTRATTSEYQAVLDGIVRDLAGEPPVGEVADYIPELARVPADRLGIALRGTDGALCAAGDSDERFSIQSIAKVLALSLATSLAPDEIRRRIGVEPSGTPFNSLVQLEYERGVPRNPLINAGALVVCDVLVEILDDPLADLLAFVRTISGLPGIDYDRAVASSELQTAFRNRALANLMKGFGNVRSDVDAVLDFYCHLCALSLTCEELATVFAFLADHGRCLPVDAPILPAADVKRINSLMLTCGFYDESGELAYSVGMPGKSGVGGGILAICPERYSVAVWSPRLNDKGNSVRGIEALRRLARATDASIF